MTNWRWASARLASIAASMVIAAAMSGSASSQEQGTGWQAVEAGKPGEPSYITYYEKGGERPPLTGICGEPGKEQLITLNILAMTGDRKDGDSADIRFSGGGQEITLSGNILKPAEGEGFAGITATIDPAHEIWQLLQSTDAVAIGLPGYAPTNILLTGGQSRIGEFVQLCRGKATASSASPSSAASDDNEKAKQAFIFARDLNSVEGYEAFLRVYPSGFYSELARGYLAKIKPSGTSQSPQTSSPGLQPVATGPDTSAWFTTRYDLDDGNRSARAAAVVAGGAQLTAYCVRNRMVGLALSEQSPGSYPQFEVRMQQALSGESGGAAGKLDINFDDGAHFRFGMSYQGLTGDVVLDQEVSSGHDMLVKLIKANSVRVTGGPLDATFQLKRSKAALCDMLGNCGGKPAECGPAEAAAIEKPRPRAERTSCKSGYTLRNGSCVRNRKKKRARKPWQPSNCAELLAMCQEGGSSMCVGPCFQ